MAVRCHSTLVSPDRVAHQRQNSRWVSAPGVVHLRFAPRSDRRPKRPRQRGGKGPSGAGAVLVSLSKRSRAVPPPPPPAPSSPASSLRWSWPEARRRRRRRGRATTPTAPATSCSCRWTGYTRATWRGTSASITTPRWPHWSSTGPGSPTPGRRSRRTPVPSSPRAGAGRRFADPSPSRPVSGCRCRCCRRSSRWCRWGQGHSRRCPARPAGLRGQGRQR